MGILTYAAALALLDQGYILDWPDRAKKAWLQKPDGTGAYVETSDAVTSRTASHLDVNGLLAPTNMKLTRFLKRRPPCALEKLEQVTQFKTTDGKFFDDQTEAAEHQETVDFVTWCLGSFVTGWTTQEVTAMSEKILQHWKVTPR